MSNSSFMVFKISVIRVPTKVAIAIIAGSLDVNQVEESSKLALVIMRCSAWVSVIGEFRVDIKFCQPNSS